MPKKGAESGGCSWIATDAEALAYVSNASLAVPLASDWVENYGARLFGFFGFLLGFLGFGFAIIRKFRIF